LEHVSSLLATITLGLGMAYLCAIVGRAAFRLPPVVGYLVAGIALGPFTPGFAADAHLTGELAEVGVALLLFGVGIHFSLADLAAVWRIAVPGAVVQVVASAAIGYAIGHWFLGWSFQPALVLGMAIAIASTAVATRTLETNGRLQTLAGHVALGWLVMQDLIVIVGLVLLPVFAHADTQSAAAAFALIGKKLVQIAAFATFVLVVGRRLIPRLLAWTARDGSRELFRLAVIVVALGVACASAEIAGVSLALGAFFAGVVLAETDLSHQAAAESVPIQQVFTVLFFVAMGMLFDPAVLLHAPLRAMAIAVAIVFGTGGFTLLLLIAFRLRAQAAATVAASLAQIGEFSFILAGSAVASGMLPPEGRDLILAAAIVTIVLNPFVFRAFGTLGQLIEQRSFLRRWQRGSAERAAPGNLPALSGHVIIVGHGRVGSIVAATLQEENIPYVVVDQNLRVVQAIRDVGIRAIYGDAGWPEVLNAARPETANLLIIAIPERGNVRRIIQTAREANADLSVIVRTHSDSEAEWLRKQAIDRVVMSERRTAMDIAAHALQSLNLDPASR
jgi:K+:H+ antiporter